MAQVSKTAVSRVIAQEKDEEPQQRSRDDFRKQKELEEARKLGNAPAAVDEEGKDINPHIPQYISDAPWYLDPKGPTLKHQRPQEERQKEYSGISEWYKKGVDQSRVATRYRKGACENCGAVTHKKKDCLERPRKVGAKFTGTNFAPDEFVNEQPKLMMSFDGKRDRWNGYDSTAHQEVIEEYAKMEELKKEMKKEKVSSKQKNVDPSELEDDAAQSSDDDEDKYVDKMDMVGTKVDAAERYTVRNLRIREDTAKYLRNLDPNSAHYDPKTRSMRKNPYESTGKTEEEVDYAGDNFVRITGDTVNHAQSQLFAWEAGGKGLDVHALAEPTKLEALKKEYSAKKTDFKSDAKKSILDKYGGVEHLEAPPRELIFSQTEDYVEYTRHGKIIKGDEDPVVRSRYEEDVHPGNHTSIFGSYYAEGKWGFKCCHSFVRNSYCTGAAGKQATENTLTLPPPNDAAEKQTEESKEPPAEKKEEKSSSSDDDEERKERAERMKEKELKMKKKRDKKKRKKDKKKKKKKKRRSSSSSSSSSSSDSEKEEEDFESKVAAAMKKQAAEERKADAMLSTDERKRKYNSLGGYDDCKQLTEAEIEAYHRKRARPEDPMSQFMSQ